MRGTCHTPRNLRDHSTYPAAISLRTRSKSSSIWGEVESARVISGMPSSVSVISRRELGWPKTCVIASDVNLTFCPGFVPVEKRSTRNSLKSTPFRLQLLEALFNIWSAPPVGRPRTRGFAAVSRHRNARQRSPRPRVFAAAYSAS